MSTATASAARGESTPLRKIVAGVAQFASYMTTLWAVQWVWDDGPLGYQVMVALVFEVLLVGMKSALFDASGKNDSIGWAGFVIDTVTNLGGILPRAAKLLTWPPVAGVLTIIGISPADTTVQTIGGFLIALIGGILLSVLPHRLWRG